MFGITYTDRRDRSQNIQTVVSSDALNQAYRFYCLSGGWQGASFSWREATA